MKCTMHYVKQQPSMLETSWKSLASFCVLAYLMFLPLPALLAQTGGVSDLTAAGTIIAKFPIPFGSGGSLSPEVIRDGVYPAVGSSNSAQEYDTYDGTNLSREDWIGYQYSNTQTFTQMVYQEGREFTSGGWFAGEPRVQVRQNGVWVDVPGLTFSTPYPGVSDGVSYQTYTLNFPAIAGDGIRLYGAPGGTYNFFSVGELRVFGFGSTTASSQQLIKLSGDNQLGLINTPLSQPLVVQLRNGQVPVAGVNLTFTVSTAGGTVSASTVTTDSNGQASVLWTPGTRLGMSSVVVSGTALTPTAFTATVNTAVGQVVNLAQGGTIIAKVPVPTSGTGSTNLEVIRDGDKPALGTTDITRQYSTNYTTATNAALKADWIGYRYTSQQTFTQIVYQEGIDSGTLGGWFSGKLTVQVLQNGSWIGVSGVTVTPNYPGASDGVSYQTYTLNFPAITGDGIRLYGAPGGTKSYISVAELEVYGYSVNSKTGSLLSKVSGDNQQSLVNSALAQPLVVRVSNGLTPVAGMTLNFTVTGGGGTVSSSSVTTDANGLASVNWTLGPVTIPLVNTLQVSGSGLSPVTFSAQGNGLLKILTLGDSITAAEGNENESYRRPLWSALKNAGYTADFVGTWVSSYNGAPFDSDFDQDHEGHPAFRSDQILPYLTTWTAGVRPDVVLIHLGTNDAIQSVAVNTTTSYLGQIIDQLRLVNPTVKIALAQIIPNSYSNVIRINVNNLNAAIPALVTQKNTAQSPVILTDQYTGINTTTDLIDGTHTNSAGDQKMANKWLPSIQTLVAPPSVVISKVSGDKQSGTIGSTLAQALVFQANNQLGQAQAGVTLAVTVLNGGGYVSSANITTNSSGQASVNWTLGSSVGSNALMVSGNGISPTYFTASANALLGTVVSLTQGGSIITKIPIPYGNAGNPNLEIIRDGDKPPAGNTDNLRQYDNYDGNNTATSDWIGYQYTSAQTFTQVVFQEGRDFGSQGGWFKSGLTVQVRQNGTWTNVSSSTVTPTYPGATDGVGYQTYTFNFSAITGDAIRLYGAPGGSSAFISVGELEVNGYQANPAPIISGFTPTNGPVETAVVISGSNLTGTTQVSFNGTAASYAVNSSTQITATVPTGATSGAIAVTTNGGTATSSSSFTVTLSVPTLTSFTPSSGTVGTAVVLTGTNFTGATAVAFNGVNASFTVNSATQITATVPAGAGSGLIVVTAPGGTVTSTTSFVVTLPAPSISSFTPTSGVTGTSVVITGANLSGTTAVTFNGVNATNFAVNSATQITTLVPAGITTGPIGVTTPAGSGISSTSFTFIVAPTISSFTPTSGVVGTSVVISGANLTGATVVTFNGVNASFAVNSSTQITATVPAGVSTGAIAVTTPGGTATSVSSFTFIPAPTISSFTPSSGVVGTSVVITGTNLAGTSSVKFNGVDAASFTVDSATQVTAVVPNGVTTGPISVTTSGGTVTSGSSFTFIPAPTLSNFTPSSGVVGTSVVVSGTNLTGTTAVKFNGVDAASFTVDSASQVTAVVPNGATSGSILLTTPGGTVTSAGSYTVTLPAPSISGFTPNTGIIGTSVVIMGANLADATVVTFNGVSASFAVNSSTQITATVPVGVSTGVIAVTTPGGTVTSGSSFTVILTPTLSNFTPSSGVVGTSVVISGTNLIGTTSVKFNGLEATNFTVDSASQVTAVVPNGVASGLISLTTAGGTATSLTAFTVSLPVPSITIFTPTSGLVGTSVVIGGTNFSGTTAVKFNGVDAASFTVDSGSQVTAVVPNGATTGLLSVTTPGGTAIGAATFTVLPTPKNVLSSMTMAILIKNEAGVIQPGVSVDLVVSGGGSVTPTNTLTDSNGQVIATWTFGLIPGVQTLTVSGTNLAPVDFSVAPY